MLIALCLIGASQLANPVELIPVDAGVADRNVLSTSLRIQPQDMRLDQAFERLYRVEGSRNRASGGSGLGLSIASALVTAHGGTLTPSASALGGLTWTLRLPLLTAS